MRLTGAETLKLQLRMIDTAFLAQTLLDGLNDTLSNIQPIHQHGLLEPGETEGISESIRDVTKAAEEIQLKLTRFAGK
jgi:hypothetical protein